MKRIIALLLLLSVLLLVSCRENDVIPKDTSTQTESVYAGESAPPDPGSDAPESNDALFDLVIEKWKTGTAGDLYRFASKDISSVMDAATFAGMFDRISSVFGALKQVTKKSVTQESGIDVYRAALDFDHAEITVQIALQDVRICGFTRDIRFKEPFEITHEDGITERYFLLENGKYALNAVYTYKKDAENAPAVLLIPGSGPCDYNETIGLLAPFEDIALGLAAEGVHSLRIEKRTLRYSDDWKATDGIGEEYLSDFSAALAFLKTQSEIGSLYLLGHSLGGQIAPVLASSDADIKGMILWNTSARHLADIAADQYTAADPANKTTYAQYAALAKAATEHSARGLYYYGVTDHYWVSYNKINVIDAIDKAHVPVLIINSTYDKQIFDADLQWWQDHFADDENVLIKIYDDLGHFGYQINTDDPTALYKEQKFPQGLITDITTFCK